jgi:hypothetical protein
MSIFRCSNIFTVVRNEHMSHKSVETYLTLHLSFEYAFVFTDPWGGIGAFINL